MSIFGYVILLGSVLGIRKFSDVRKKMEIQMRRANLFTFSSETEQKNFESIVLRTCKSVKRIQDVKIDGVIIYCTVLSQSGISKWNFVIDLNDYGHLTGKYWIYSDNDDSKIPNSVAERILELIF